MNALRVLYQMVRADFLERVRRYSFLVILAAALYLAYGVATEKIWMVVGDGYRGLYNPAWIGALMSVCCSTFLSLAGFYIVKNSVQRDTDTRVGQILAATPMRKDFYTIAKTLSNFAVLACMVAVLMVSAVVMEAMHSESHSLSLWKLWAPFIFLVLPAMLLTASLALLFETIPVLRGGVGNVVYFFVWTAMMGMGAAGLNDPSGLQLLFQSTRKALRTVDPSHAENFHFSLTIGGEHAVRTFLWDGIDWTANVLLMRLFWVGLAIAFALLASAVFHRFDPARAWRSRRAATAVGTAAKSEDPAVTGAISVMPVRLTPLVRDTAASGFMQLVVSELRLMLKGQRWWWYLTAAGLLAGEFFSPDRSVRSGFLLAAWIWPIFCWSQMGCREVRHNTGALLFSSERSLTRQLPALWTAGFCVALLAGSGVAIRLMFAGDIRALAGWIAGALFIPSVALSLGIWTGSSKAFEAIYTVWWYVGPAHQIPGLDFMATTPASSSPGSYALAAALLLAGAYWRRRHSLGYA